MKTKAHEEIAKRAYALWEAEDCVDGHDVEHWLRAEAAWIAERRHGPRVVVRSRPIRSAGTSPAEWERAEPLAPATGR